MTIYRIFPSIGIARLGQDDNFFIGPEIPGLDASELQNDGSTRPVGKYKDASSKKIRKQGARFHLFESEDGQTWVPANLPPEAVTWKVALVNKKSAVTRPGEPPKMAVRPVVPDGNQKMVIDGGIQSITGKKTSSAILKGVYETTNPDGSVFKVDVDLGQLKTDGQGRLIVLGGNGVSSAPEKTPLGPSYYRNPKWHDDVSDGPITAEIKITPDAAPIEAQGGAWVIVGPPDYAPAIQCVITLYDVIRQVGIDLPAGSLPAPGRPSFQQDIKPIITRVKRLRWVHDTALWSDPRLDDKNLGKAGDSHNELRKKVLDEVILEVQEVFAGHTSPSGPPYRLRKFQVDFLNDWAAGKFDDMSIDPVLEITAAGLTRAALETAAGQGFCPGIEAGILMTDPGIYLKPFDFRIDHSIIKPGDLTALMAQPWQADFVDCNTNWWPTQRPDLAFKNATDHEEWVRGAESKKLMVECSSRLGILVKEGNTEVYLERERDPLL